MFEYEVVHEESNQLFRGSGFLGLDPGDHQLALCHQVGIALYDVHWSHICTCIMCSNKHLLKESDTPMWKTCQEGPPKDLLQKSSWLLLTYPVHCCFATGIPVHQDNALLGVTGNLTYIYHGSKFTDPIFSSWSSSAEAQVGASQRFVAFDNGRRQNLNNSLNMHPTHYWTNTASSESQYINLVQINISFVYM